MLIRLRGGALIGLTAALGALVVLPRALPAEEPLVVTATRLEVPESESPAAVTVLEVPKLTERQIDRVAEALRDVPGIDVVQTGAPGQLTSVFTRGLNSNHTQVLIDGIPLNQGFAGLFDFANLTTTGLDRIEVQRGPLSSLYGPRALGGVVQIFTKQGAGPVAGEISFEGGSFDSFRERAGVAGSIGSIDYMASASRFDTDNQRPNNQYRETNAIVNLGWSPLKNLRIGVLTTFANNDTGNPGPTYAPKPLDNLLTKEFLIAPNITYTPVTWWKHRLIVSYDTARQTNDPNQDGFTGPTTARFVRTQVDYQNDAEITKWLTLTSGMFYANNSATQERPQVLFGPKLIGDHTTEIAGFAQATLRPIRNLLLVVGGRIDSFSDFGTVGTWRVAGSYVVTSTGTTLRSSYATGYAPPSIQDKIFRMNVNDVLQPERSRGFDVGFEQALWKKQLIFGANFFYNHLTNLIGFDTDFNTFNLGRARTQGVEAFARWEPVKNLIFNASYTYLDARQTGSGDISRLDGSRLPRRARNQLAAAVSYKCFGDRLTAGFEGRLVNGREDTNFALPNSEIPDYSVCRLWANYQVTKAIQAHGADREPDESILRGGARLPGVVPRIFRRSRMAVLGRIEIDAAARLEGLARGKRRRLGLVQDDAAAEHDAKPDAAEFRLEAGTAAIHVVMISAARGAARHLKGVCREGETLAHAERPGFDFAFLALHLGLGAALGPRRADHVKAIDDARAVQVGRSVVFHRDHVGLRIGPDRRVLVGEGLLGLRDLLLDGHLEILLHRGGRERGGRRLRAGRNERRRGLAPGGRGKQNAGQEEGGFHFQGG